MRNSKGITLVALVITVIILLILAGITLNLTVGENGIIRRAIEAGQNYQNSAQYEQEMLDELMKQTDNWIGDTEKPDDESGDRNPYESEFRKLVAEAITNEGVATEVADTDETFITNIGKILQERTKDATATADNITEGKTAWVNGEKITGTNSNSYSTNVEVLYNYSTTSSSTVTQTYTFTKNYSKVYVLIGGGNSGDLSSIGSCTSANNSQYTIKQLSYLLSRSSNVSSGLGLYELSDVKEGEQVTWHANYYPTCVIFSINANFDNSEVLYTYTTTTASSATETYTFTKDISKAYVVVVGGNKAALSTAGECIIPDISTQYSIRRVSYLISSTSSKSSSSAIYELSDIKEGEQVTWHAGYYPTCVIFNIN